MYIMGWFNRKKDRVIDLTDHYHKVHGSQESAETNGVVDLSSNSPETVPSNSGSSGGFVGIFGDANASGSAVSSPQITENSSSTLQERKQRLAKRLKDMTDKLEDVSNQIYHLQQRIEVLERKSEKY
jgi:peptidoglycan hydrolase CwlO-like protein